MGHTFQLKLLESAQGTTSTEKISIPSYYKLAVIMKCSSPTVTVAGLEVFMTLECYEIQTFLIMPQIGMTTSLPRIHTCWEMQLWPLKTWIMTPYKDNGHLTEQQKTYNYLHSSTRMVIERAFALRLRVVFED